MTFIAQHNTTDEKREMSEAEVRQEIIDTLQHDMETCQEYSDDEIADNRPRTKGGRLMICPLWWAGIGSLMSCSNQVWLQQRQVTRYLIFYPFVHFL